MDFLLFSIILQLNEIFDVDKAFLEIDKSIASYVMDTSFFFLIGLWILCNK